MKSVEAPPKASILIESMRDIGYSLETSMADIIDNSIAAHATAVHIHVDAVGPEARIAIVDDGVGMSSDGLIDAMRLGSRHPHERRAARDLGRFGLGLKTASFSQCRRLTVVARKDGVTSAAVWDLDHVASKDSWSLQIPSDATLIPFAEHLGPHGVLVLWERLDRAIEVDGTESGRKQFIREVTEAGKHLELVFHRYLSGEAGIKRVKILLNNVPLVPFDPFHSAHPSTEVGRTEVVRVSGHDVAITAFTLPHHRNVTAAEWEHYGGAAGYLKNQGFYLYREKRLIIHGTWFGLARQMELTKLTRVRIDTPNGLDAAWHVDVKKASARPPLKVRERLQGLLGTIGAPSRRVYTQRGQKLHGARLPVWQRLQANNAIIYRLNADNPIISGFHADLPEDLRGDFARTLQVISAALPMDALFADLANSPDSVRGEPLPEQSLRSLLRTTVTGLRAAGVPAEVIPDTLRVTEPFRSNWDSVEALLEESRGELSS
jgi:hypothetical protein